jgi:hypothetical protein
LEGFMITAWIVPIVCVVLLAALVVGVAVRRKQPAKRPPQLHLPVQVPAIDPAAALFADGNRPTEDDIAQARLGGPRGARELGEAPMVRQVAVNTPTPVDPGHVA